MYIYIYSFVVKSTYIFSLYEEILGNMCKSYIYILFSVRVYRYIHAYTCMMIFGLFCTKPAMYNIHNIYIYIYIYTDCASKIQESSNMLLE